MSLDAAPKKIVTEKPAPVEVAAPAGKGKPKPKHEESVRDTIESILFAFILAFLYRTFEQEAFVIPTGSMAPTLYGRHKEGDCEACGFHITVGASQEFDADRGVLGQFERITAAGCPNCGFINTSFRDALAFNGDRILVNKFPYEFGEPHRWDVFVFKFPEQPKINYIKRLVGLPGETLRIRGGNLYSVAENQEAMLRKDPAKQKVLQIPVYDDAHAPEKLIAAGWPERWGSMTLAEQAGEPVWQNSESGWKPDRSGRTYTLSSPAGDAPQWLRYRHYLPDSNVWQALERQAPLAPRARLIGDLCGYNLTVSKADPRLDNGPFWVGDLTINLRLELRSVTENSSLQLELCEGTSWYRCRINPQTGAALLEEVNTQLGLAAKTLAEAKNCGVRGTGTYDLAFANVDNRLCLWVNHRLVDFGAAATLPDAGATGNPYPAATDLTPVGFAGSGVEATLSRLILERDTYYRVAFPGNMPVETWSLAETVHSPQQWGRAYADFLKDHGQRDIKIDPDHFLAFGDNSPESNDSRMWTHLPPAVPREYLVGKAFFIYWPHGVPFLNDGQGYTVLRNREVTNLGLDGAAVPKEKDPSKLAPPRYTIPFYPQFWRMHRIR